MCQSRKDDDSVTTSPARILIRSYGPYAFGIVSLLVMWQFIVRPEIDNNKINAQALLQAAESIKTAADSTKQTAEINKYVTQRLDAIVTRLEKYDGFAKKEK